MTTDAEWRAQTLARMASGEVWRSPLTYTISCIGEEGYVDVPEDGHIEAGDMTGRGGIGMYVFDARPLEDLPSGKAGWYGSVQPLYDKDSDPGRR